MYSKSINLFFQKFFRFSKKYGLLFLSMHKFLLSKANFSDFRKKILSWYHPDHRKMPRKGEKSPYKIWISEIILQQTRVQQGWDYYVDFLETFPTLQDLAGADIDEVLKAWQGLGYYSRARNLHQGARQVVERFDGHLLADYHALLKISGIGPYTAAAIASFAFGLPHAVVDGNVVRILARYFSIETAFDTTEGKRIFAEVADKVLDTADPGRFNQAMMDFGATICTPAAPRCDICPLREQCLAFSSDKISDLPVKSKKIIRRERFFNYFIIRSGDSCLLFRRQKGDIYAGMYEFLLWESRDKPTTNHIDQWLHTNGVNGQSEFLCSLPPQILTHQKINATFHIIYVAVMPQLESAIEVAVADLHKFAFPKFIQTAIDRAGL